MKNKRTWYLALLFSILLAMLGISAGVYANGVITLDKVVTQNDFHLSTDVVKIYNNGIADGMIDGNLFSFTHSIGDSGPYDSGAVIEWTFINMPTGEMSRKISGNFVIDKNPDPSGQHGKIYVSFTAAAQSVPLLEGETGPNYNFSGACKITGGEGLYEGISGRGTIAGTFQNHDYADAPRAVDFVMTGRVLTPR